VLPIRFDEKTIDDLFARTLQHPGYQLTVDLERQCVTDAFGLEIPFEVDAFRRHCLLNGLDDIGLTLEHEPRIAAYERAHGIA
jgi:3-isopropylmalate/(R)-2-methylmalate dehydratase small subunit